MGSGADTGRPQTRQDARGDGAGRLLAEFHKDFTRDVRLSAERGLLDAKRFLGMRGSREDEEQRTGDQTEEAQPLQHGSCHFNMLTGELQARSRWMQKKSACPHVRPL